MTTMSQRYVTITEPMNLWWDGDTRIHYTTADGTHSEFHRADGIHDGLRVVWSSNPRSADYNPGNFNRAARVLRAAGCDAPNEVPERSRRLRDRFLGALKLRPEYER